MQLRDDKGRLTMFALGLLMIACGAILFVIDHFSGPKTKSVLTGTNIPLETVGIAGAALGLVVAIGAAIVERRSAR